MMRRKLRRVCLCLGLAGILAAGLGGGWMLLYNNWSVDPESRAEFVKNLNDAITRSREWVVDVGESRGLFQWEETAALLENAALLHMVADCARLSGDERLQSVAMQYFRVVRRPYAFGRLIDAGSRFEPPADYESQALEDYQRWFLHATAPAEYPLTAEDRANMFSPGRYRTGRATHQLLSLYLYRNHNGSTPELDRLIRRISTRIASEAAIDFRVTDLYLQRIAFVLAAGQPDLVKRRWVERALAAQQADGGWLWSWHGWQPKPYVLSFDAVSSTSHPTAQGMWIAYMLKYRYPEWIERNYR
jgi:hypothetical protein